MLINFKSEDIKNLQLFNQSKIIKATSYLGYLATYVYKLMGG